MDWQGHYHGYTWTGPQREYNQEYPRRPEHPDFLLSPVPPLMIGNWLLKRRFVRRDRTWDDPQAAIAWLVARYREAPQSAWEGNDPAGHADGSALESWIETSSRSLRSGKPVVWGWPPTPGTKASHTIVACPSDYPETTHIPCPLSSA